MTEIYQVGADFGRSIPPSVNTSRRGQIGNTFLTINQNPNVPEEMVGGHYTGVRQGPGTGGSDIPQPPYMVSGHGHWDANVPAMRNMTGDHWSRAYQPPFYSGGGGLGTATPPFMGPSWSPGPQSGGNVGNVNNRVFVSGHPSQVSNQYARRSPWHGSRGFQKTGPGTVYNISQARPTAIQWTMDDFLTLGIFVLLGSAIGYGFAGLRERGPFKEYFLPGPRRTASVEEL